MEKRVSVLVNPLHMGLSDPAPGGGGSPKANDAPGPKRPCNSGASKTNSKGVHNLPWKKSMDPSLSRISTSESLNSSSQEGSGPIDASDSSNQLVKDIIASVTPGSDSLSLPLSQEQELGEPSEGLRAIVKQAILKKLPGFPLRKSKSDLVSPFAGQEDKKEKLTPSRRADYVHTLLSGRSSQEDSISLFNRLTSLKEKKMDKSAEEDTVMAKDSPDFSENEAMIEDSTTTSDHNVALSSSYSDESPSNYPPKADVQSNQTETGVDLSNRQEVCLGRYSDLADDESLLESSTMEFDCERDPMEVDELISRYKRLYNDNYFNKNNSESAKLRVVVRCRPTSSANKVVECDGVCVKLLKPGDKNSVFKSQRPRVYEFNFDYIVPEGETTEHLYNSSCLDLVQKFISGTSVTVFAYGSTGSGKTHTITGTEASTGLIHLVMGDLFQCTQGDKAFYMSYFEVYNENVYDLLKENERNLHLQEVESVVVVKGLTKVRISNMDDFKQLFEVGNRNRKVFTTNANRCSSRSHAILQVHSTSNSKLTFIDLAGSERMKITENTGDRLKESSYINQSLLALINCISTLSKNSQASKNSTLLREGVDNSGYQDRVKYRDSKLTHLLKNSLSRNCFILMIAHVNPEGKFYQDSYNTIKYALRAKDVEITQVITKGNCGKEVLKSFASELLDLVNLMKKQLSEQQLHLMREHISQSHMIGQQILLELLQKDS